MRGADERDVGFAVAVEVGDRGGVEPAHRLSRRRRLSQDRPCALAAADDRQRRALVAIGLDPKDLGGPVAVEVGQARRAGPAHGAPPGPDLIGLDRNGPGARLMAAERLAFRYGDAAG